MQEDNDEELKQVQTSPRILKLTSHTTDTVEIEENPSDRENYLSVAQSLTQPIDGVLEDENFNTHLNNLSYNKLVKLVQDHIDLISGKQIEKTYGKSKDAIL